MKDHQMEMSLESLETFRFSPSMENVVMVADHLAAVARMFEGRAEYSARFREEPPSGQDEAGRVADRP